MLGAVLTAGASILGGAMASRSSNKATSAAQGASQDQIRLARESRDRNIDLNQPFRQAGIYGQNALLYELGLGGKPQDASIGSFTAGDGSKTYFLSGYDGQGQFKGSTGWHSKDRAELEKYMQDNPTRAYEGLPEYHSWEQDPLYQDKPADFDWRSHDLYQRVPEWVGAFNWDERNPLYRDKPQEYERGEFETSPGYQFRMDEANKNLSRSASSQGLSLSGASMKALNEQVQGIASNEYGNWFNQELATEQQANQNRGLYDQAYTTAKGVYGADRDWYGRVLAARDNAYAMAKGMNQQDQAMYGGAVSDYMGRATADRQTGLSWLSSLSGMGSGTTANMMTANNAYTNAATAALGQSGQAAADNAINQSNIFNNTLNNLAGTYSAHRNGLL